MVPLELCNEVISYLWNDKEALVACSLASRILTTTSHKFLFAQITIVDEKARKVAPKSGGTSSAFYRLLDTSPHIAEYVECLQILDAGIAESWLIKDTFLCLSLPLLPKLKAFVFYFLYDWSELCEEFCLSLRSLMQLPSLLYVELTPLLIFAANEMFSNNIRHLSVHSHLHKPFRLETSTKPPIYLESLSLFGSGALQAMQQNLRFKLSNLQRLLISTHMDMQFYYDGLWSPLQSCRHTLEEFIFNPCLNDQQLPSAVQPKIPIDLSQMTALRKMVLVPWFCPERTIVNPFWAFNQFLTCCTSSTYPILEHLTAAIEVYVIDSLLQHWEKASNILHNRCPRLKKLTILVLAHDPDVTQTYLSAIKASANMQIIHAQHGVDTEIVVEPRKCWKYLSKLAPESQWENVIVHGEVFQT